MLRTYYFDLMPSGLKARYNDIKKEISAAKPKVTLPNMLQSEMESFIESLLNESPELFHIELHSIYYGEDGYMMAMLPSYFHVNEKSRVFARLDKVIAEIGKKRNAYEQVIAIVNWMYRLNYVNTNSPDEHTIYGPLMRGEGVCEGFSLLFMLLCQRFNIDAMVATGDIVGATDKHAWNVVSINGRKYNVDLTSAIAVKKDYGLDLYSVLVPDYIIDDHISPVKPYCGMLSDNPYYREGQFYTSDEELKEKMRYFARSAKEVVLLDCSEEGINALNAPFLRDTGAKNVQAIGRYLIVSY